jgi:hypothetical protein
MYPSIFDNLRLFCDASSELSSCYIYTRLEKKVKRKTMFPVQ